MPLHDGYESEKNLKTIALNLAPALTTVLNEVEKDRYGFILMVVDIREGLMQYISDQDPHKALEGVEQWCIRRAIDLEEK